VVPKKVAKKADSNSKKNIYFPTGLRFENKYPKSYLYTPPESLEILEEFFKEDKKKSEKKIHD